MGLENARVENDGQKLRGLENAGLENDGQTFSKLWAQLRGQENAGLENDGKAFSNCEHNYVCIFDVYLANYRKTLLELD